MIIQFLLILTICMDASSCRRVNYGWYTSESECHREAAKHREAVKRQCVVVMGEAD